MDFVWVNGQRREIDDDHWHEAAAGFWGLGFRTRLPVTKRMSDPVRFHQGLAEVIASRLGRTFDPTPWRFVEGEHFPAGIALEIVGGWPSADPTAPAAADAPAWTAVSLVRQAAHDATYGAGVALPWVYDASSPLSGLPTLSRMDDSQAARHLVEVGASVGLWWNASPELVASTAGVPLIQVGRRSWVYPRRGASFTPSWAFHNVAMSLSAMPEEITEDLIGSSRAVTFISDIGDVTVLDTLNGRPLAVDRDLVLTLLASRLDFLL